jgi:ABC-2 type transport system ATP-binding protein
MYSDPRDLGELSERLALGSFARTQVRRLSGGERQRLALAAAVVGRPEVLFLDEPSAGMDPAARLAVWDLVRELRAAGTTIVLTTHQMSEAEELADRVVVVDHGAVLAAGTTAEVVGDGGTVRVTVRPLPGNDGEPEAAPAALAADLTAALARATAVSGTAAPRVEPAAAAGTFEVRAAAGHEAGHGLADPALLHAITGWAADAGLLITALTTGRRTLEDVFLELTGRTLR